MHHVPCGCVSYTNVALGEYTLERDDFVCATVGIQGEVGGQHSSRDVFKMQDRSHAYFVIHLPRCRPLAQLRRRVAWPRCRPPSLSISMCKKGFHAVNIEDCSNAGYDVQLVFSLAFLRVDTVTVSVF